MTKDYARRARPGFTIIELTLSIGFLAILLISILMITLISGKMYLKGNTNRTVNQASRDFADTVTRDFLSSSTGSIAVPEKSALATGSSAYSGRVCFGSQVAYLWNTADLINGDPSNTSGHLITKDGKAIRFARITNPQAKYCVKDADENYPMTISDSENFSDLFGPNQGYALYSMNIHPIASSGQRAMFELTYTLGTDEKDTTEVKDGVIECKPSNEYSANFNFCSISDFDMIVRVGGVA